MKNISIKYNREFDLIRLILFIALICMLILSFSSCSAKWHIKRAIKKDPTILQADTVTIRDTVFLAEIRHDTAFLMQNDVDTFVIEKERLKVEIRRYYDTLKVNAECAADTVVRVVKVQYKKVEYKETLADIIKPCLFWIFLILLILALFRFFNPL